MVQKSVVEDHFRQVFLPEAILGSRPILSRRRKRGRKENIGLFGKKEDEL